ncbi:UNVERIFIED_ORG: ketosteroid isomerase-like protein [Gordonia westfalica J30]
MEPMERVQYFFDAVNRKDADAALSCYEATAVLDLGPDGGTATGTDEVRDALAAFLTMEMELAGERELRSADGQLALTSLEWKASGADGEGNPITLTGKSTEVLRRQADGDWLMVLDSPWWIG